jgi:methyltransferase family protein
MNVRELLANLPKVHGPEGSPTDMYRLEDAIFDFLDQYLAHGMKTLELGAGSSTVIFAIKGTGHTCIVPDEKQIQRIREYCELHAISLSNVTFIAEKSQDALPKITQRDFDCILIDGSHGFPSPFVDWYYSAGLLKIGGIVIVDDLHIWTCSTLADFLLEEPEWRVVKETARSAVFMKIQNGSQHKEWIHQAYVLRRSRGTAILPKFSYGLRLLRRGEIGLLIRNALLKMVRS